MRSLNLWIASSSLSLLLSIGGPYVLRIKSLLQRAQLNSTVIYSIIVFLEKTLNMSSFQSVAYSSKAQ